MNLLKTFTPESLHSYSFKKQWRLGLMMLFVMALACSIAMFLAWRLYQPRVAIDALMKRNASIALKTEKINSQTAFLLFTQQKLINDFKRFGTSALELTSYSRQQLQSSSELLSAQVSQLNASLDDASTPEAYIGEASHNVSHILSIQTAAINLSHQLELFQGLNLELIKSLLNQSNGRQTPSDALELQSQRQAFGLNQASNHLTLLASAQAVEMIGSAKSDEAFFLKGILLFSGFALLWNGGLLYLLSRSLKINAAQAKTLSNLASLDPLTGLLNRRALRQRLHENTKNQPLTTDMRKSQSGFETLVLIDLDHFKKFNDQFGHVKGDAHLQACAKLWMKNSRAQDSIARIGGEEFALLMPNCDSIQASVSVNRMLALMPDGTSFSSGIATRIVDEPFESWYSRADAALYRAKSQGRAQTVIASSGEKMTVNSGKKMSVKPVKQSMFAMLEATT